MAGPSAAPPVLTPNWFKDTFLGIEVEQFLGLAVLVVLALAAQRIAVGLIALYIRYRVTDDSVPFWTRERRRLNRPLLGLTVAITILVGFPVLDFDADVEDVLQTLGRLLGGGSAVWLTYRAVDIFADVLRRRAELTETKLDDQLVPLVRTTLKIFVAIIGVLFVLQNLDVNIASLIAGLGIGGLAVALAAQDTIKNLLGGVTIFTDKPFQVGDVVTVGDVTGTVEAVGFRSTRVRTFYDSLVTIPNARMTDTDIDNWRERRWRRYRTTLSVAYHTEPQRLQAFVEGVRAILRTRADIRQDNYLVEFAEFGAHSLDIVLQCFIAAAGWNQEMRTRHVLNLDVMRLAERLEVEFAFPTQTLHVSELPGQPPALPPLPTGEELAAVIDDFGPEGAAGQRANRPLSEGYDSG